MASRMTPIVMQDSFEIMVSSLLLAARLREKEKNWMAKQ